MSERDPLHDYLLLDACCAINLFATPYAGEILAAYAQPIAIAQFVVEHELLYLAAGLTSENSSLVEILAEIGIVTVAMQEDEEEQFLALASQLDDGEAISAAIAMERGWAIATDDRRVPTVLAKAGAAMRVVTTPELVKHWAEHAQVDRLTLRSVLADIEAKARFRPWRTNPLYAWWQASI